MIPLAGKNGRVQTSLSSVVVNHEFSDWTLESETEIIIVDGFEKAPDAHGNMLHQGLDGLSGGLATLKGRWNAAITPTIALWNGKHFTGTDFIFLGLTHAIGFTLLGWVKKIGPDTDVKDAANFKCDFFVEAITAFPG